MYRLIKRESGGNPGQSRCCEFHYVSLSLFESLDKGLSGKTLEDGNESEDLPCIVSALLSRKKRGSMGL
jgi:hypothetical protein